MAKYGYEIEVDGKTFEIDSARKLSPEELRAAGEKMRAAAPAEKEGSGPESIGDFAPKGFSSFAPRTSALPADESMFSRKSLAAQGSDALSSVGRTVASLPALWPGGESFGDAMSRTKGKEREGFFGNIAEFAGDVVRDPATMAAAPIGGPAAGPAKAVGRRGLAELGKRGAQILGKGALEGLASGTAHQVDKYGQGEGFSVEELAGETALGAGMALGGKLTEKTLKKALTGGKETANKIMASYLKAPLRIYDDGFKPENIAKHNLFGTTDEIVQMASQQIKQKSDELSGLIDAAAGEGAEVDLAKAFTESLGDILENKRDLKAPQLFLSSGDAPMPIEKAAESMKKLVGYLSDGNSKMDLKAAQKLKQTIGNLGDWTHGQTDADLSAVEALSNRLYINLKNQIDAKLPASAKALNKEMSEIIPIKRAALRRLPIDQRNDILGLADITAFANAFGSASRAGGEAAGSLGIARKVLRSPTTAEAFNLLGTATEPLAKPILAGTKAAGPSSAKAVRTSLFAPNEELGRRRIVR